MRAGRLAPRYGAAFNSNRENTVMSITDDIIRIYLALVHQQSIDMWLRGEIRWASLRGVLS